MKLCKAFVMAVMVCALPMMAWADGCPAGGGSWSTMNGMDPGRAVVSNCGGGGLQVGDMTGAASWDGVSVGAQWTVTGITETSVVIDDSGINPDGSGVRIAYTTYSGGVFSLDPDGPWGHAAGSTDNIEGVMDSASGTVKIYRLAGGITYNVTSDINGTGHITSCGPMTDCTVTYAFALSQMAWQGDPATDNPLPDYPPFELCDGNLPPLASQWNSCQMGFGLECTVDSESTTWGSLKALYQ